MTLAILDTITPRNVLPVKYLDERELNNFESSIDMTVMELSIKYDCDVYIQGSEDRRWEAGSKRFINAFSGSLSNYYCGNRVTSPQTIIISHNLDSSTVVYDFAGAGEPAKKTYKDNNNNILARLDADGNIWFCDFYHNENSRIDVVPFSGFYKILLDAWGEAGSVDIAKLLRDSISPLDPSRIVRIESEFDKDTYVREVERRYEEAVGLQGCIQNSKILSLTTVLASERMAREKIILDSSATSFAQGVTFAKKNDGWEFKNGRLYWKRRIEMKYCNYYDRSWELPDSEIDKYFIEGLNFMVSPRPTQALAEKSYHPNVSGANSVCIGDLHDHILSDILEKLPSMLETGGLTHPFDSEKAWDIIALMVNEKGEFPEETCKINKRWNIFNKAGLDESVPTPEQVLARLKTRAERIRDRENPVEAPVDSPMTTMTITAA